MTDIYSLSDAQISQKIGARLKSVRLKQNITQQELANQAVVSVSSIKKIESGHICSFDSLLRIMRILGSLDLLQELTEDETLSPNEYFEMVNSRGRRLRKRARNKRMPLTEKEESEW